MFIIYIYFFSVPLPEGSILDKTEG